MIFSHPLKFTFNIKNLPSFLHHLPVRFQGAEPDVAVPAVSLSLLVEGAIGGGGLGPGCGGVARGRIRVRRDGRRRRCWYYCRWYRRRRVHPHVAVQRHLLVGAVRAVRTTMQFPALGLAA